ncbi:MAG: PEP-CTERM sorting domain-containing protein [Crocosphaera sp.]
MNNQIKLSIVLATSLTSLIISTTAKGLSISFYGEDLTAGGTFVPNGNAVQAQNDFLSQLSGVSTEDFEGFTAGDTGPLSLSFVGGGGNINGNLTATGTGSVATGSFAGVFPTSGSQFWVANSQFSIDFDTPIIAFGFFVTDIENNPFTLRFDLVEGGTTDIQIPATTPAPNGALAYFGIIDTDNPFTSATFIGPSSDGFGFDDLTVGDVNQVASVPEPATILGTLFAFGSAGLMKHKKRK